MRWGEYSQVMTLLTVLTSRLILLHGYAVVCGEKNKSLMLKDVKKERCSCLWTSTESRSQ